MWLFGSDDGIEVVDEPEYSLFEVISFDMTDEIDGSPTAFSGAPVHELHSVDGNGAHGGVPLFFVEAMGGTPASFENLSQLDPSESVQLM